MEQIKISVVMPSYGTSYDIVKRSLDSIKKQTFQAFEIIVVDDNDDDDFRLVSRKLAREFSESVIFLFNEKNSGANFSRNKGILAAHGEFVAFLDSDDEWPRNYLEEVQKTIKEKGAQFVTTNYQVVHEEGVLPPVFNRNEFVSGDVSYKELYQDLIGPTSTVVISKKIIVDAGLFDESLPARQDYDMWLRVTKMVPVYYNYSPCVKVFRVGRKTISSSYKRNVLGTQKVLSKILGSNNFSDSERNAIIASHLKHMALSCILCNAYKDARPFAIDSLKKHFDKSVLAWLILSYFPFFFSWLRNMRKKMLYRQKWLVK